ncbi:carbamate kinase [Pseudonocardia asaccharolytica]|uniref:Carbamate kinase n=1 Tax=Pseudonocardia asaccharolytica DSM 44247 = NBRC 16224 TaxID=1123024 RepID=A0A511D7S8_9PSEU|nr:carbamate kinase [Pseudonocardia asaccharolytica]GEL20869.1 carbamate kinase [Pseudonocardia asaccharolytica DSM 44247 = NBRC 16224]
MSRTAIVALGGNAFTREDQQGTYAEQAHNARAMAQTVHALRRTGWNVVVVHGNGPQVGNLAIQHEEGAALVPPLPLSALGAMTQGQLGSLIAMSLHQTAPRDGVEVAAVVTHVAVSLDDPAFADPRKPIGPFFHGDAVTEMIQTRGWTMAEDAGRGHRRVVASPQPHAIVEARTIRTLVEDGVIVVAAGGGGVPVVDDGRGYTGVDAVVDKDYAAQRLANQLGAEALVLVTGVPHVALDFGTPQQRTITEIGVDEMEEHLHEGQFPEGSMGPKVRAAIHFLRNGGGTVVITTPEYAASALSDAPGLDGRMGTRIVPLCARNSVRTLLRAHDPR